MRHTLILLCSLAFGPLLLSSCKKDDGDAPSTVGSGGTNSLAQAPVADGYLGASRVVSQGTTGYNGSAYFMGDSMLTVDVGTVSLNGLELTNSSDFYSISGNTSSLDLSSGTVLWDVQGGNGYSAFVENVDNIDFPYVHPINSADTLDKSAGFTLSCEAIDGADQVVFSTGFMVMKRLVGTATTCTFTPTELSGLSLGANVVLITAYTYSPVNIGGKTISFSKSHTLYGSVHVVD